MNKSTSHRIDHKASAGVEVTNQHLLALKEYKQHIETKSKLINNCDQLDDSCLVDVLKTWVEAEPLREAWDQHVQSIDGPVFSGYDWCRAWWEVYGDRRELRIFIIRSNNEIVAILPMFIERIGIWPTSLLIAKVIGSDHTVHQVDIALNIGSERQTVKAVYDHLLSVEQCDVVTMGPLLIDTPRAQSFVREAYKTEGIRVKCRQSDHPLTVYKLSESIGEQMSLISKNERKTLRKRWNRLERDWDVRIEIVHKKDESASTFEEFIRLHQSQWQPEGLPGHFVDWQGIEEFHKKLVNELSDNKGLCIIQIMAGDRPIAVQYGYTFGSWYHAILTARQVNDEFNQYGIGRLMFIKTLESAINLGLKWVDGGRGRYEYKISMGGEEEKLGTVFILRDKVSSRVRLSGLLTVSSLINLFYYRIWLHWIRPRFGPRKRPLWSVWVRTRL